MVRFDKDAPLTAQILSDPSHPVTNLILRVYSFKSFLFSTVNAASRNGDVSKIDTLGPYAQALNRIIQYAGYNRDDIDKEDLRGMDLYRGLSLTEFQIQRYREAAKSGDVIKLFGYSSCSKDIRIAFEYAEYDRENN